MLTFKAHDKAVRALAFSPDGRLLATAGHDRLVRTWAMPGNVAQRALFGGEGWSSLDYSPDGRYLGWAGKGLRVWDLVTGETVLDGEPSHDYVHCCFSADGTAFLLVSRTMQLLTWIVSDNTARPGQFTPWVDYLQAHPVERRGRYAFFADAWGSVVCYSPDGRTRALVHGPDLRVFDAADRLIATRRVNRRHLEDLAFTADGARLVTVSNDETVRVWDAAAWQEVGGYSWQIGKLGCLAVSPDGMRMAAGSHTGKVVVWDVD